MSVSLERVLWLWRLLERLPWLERSRSKSKNWSRLPSLWRSRSRSSEQSSRSPS
ncbi:MAG: hypothetical protein ABEI99_10800 [Halobaculum sp.]